MKYLVLLTMAAIGWLVLIGANAVLFHVVFTLARALA